MENDFLLVATCCHCLIRGKPLLWGWPVLVPQAKAGLALCLLLDPSHGTGQNGAGPATISEFDPLPPCIFVAEFATLIPNAAENGGKSKF